MKRIGLYMLIAVSLMSLRLKAQEELSPYFQIAQLDGNIEEAVFEINSTIQSGGFKLVGEYHPAENPGLAVVCFTSQELKDLSLQFKDRGALASVLKAALVEENGKITLSILNPEYTFLAYWGGQLNGQEKELKEMSDKVIKLFSHYGKPQPYGGFVKRKNLPEYHYMMTMPYFDEPVELNEYNSFEEGVEMIRKNLDAKVGNTIKVYEQSFIGKDIMVFGIGLYDKETGEGNFLPVVGEGHIANLPYEIILEGKQATMLHGKYRIAIYWPELTMGTFMKISSTPGEIEETMIKVAGGDAD